MQKCKWDEYGLELKIINILKESKEEDNTDYSFKNTYEISEYFKNKYPLEFEMILNLLKK